MKKCCERKNFSRDTFQNLWFLITQDIESQKNLQPSDTKDNFSQDPYFKEVPISQEYLTESCMICHEMIDYSNLKQLIPEHIKNTNLYDCFHGILFYIFYYSKNKLNTEELEFHFSGGQSIKDYSKINQNSTKTGYNQWNILNIFNYLSADSGFHIESTKNAFFGISFKRIKITPISYSIRSGTNQNNLISFTFEGYDEDSRNWDILDERVNINDLIPNGSFKMFYVHTTKKSYSLFKVQQTDPGSNGYWGFSIAAFDIYGSVSIRESLFYSPADSLLINRSTSLDLFDFDKYNPIIDMSEYIY